MLIFGDFVRKLVFMAFMLCLVLAGLAQAQETNYFCVLCGKGPLSGRIWMSKWGPICDDCYTTAQAHCSICGMPITTGFGKTGDGRYVCKFDLPNAIMDEDAARDLFADVRSDLVQLIGSSFALEYPSVKVSLFDVDYWSETGGRQDSLHLFGFAHSRPGKNGEFTHEVVMLSGRLRSEMSATAAHEYTHLWINENKPESHELEKDTLEGICELVSYKLMESRGDTNEEQHILTNPYTHGEIVKLVALEQDRGMAYILNWVKNGTTTTLEEADAAGAAAVAPYRMPMVAYTNAPPALPDGLRLSGLMLGGWHPQAIVDGASFQVGDRKTIKLSSGPVDVRCMAIRQNEVVMKVSGVPDPITLKMGKEIVP